MNVKNTAARCCYCSLLQPVLVFCCVSTRPWPKPDWWWWWWWRWCCWRFFSFALIRTHTSIHPSRNIQHHPKQQATNKWYHHYHHHHHYDAQQADKRESRKVGTRESGGKLPVVLFILCIVHRWKTPTNNLLFREVGAAFFIFGNHMIHTYNLQLILLLLYSTYSRFLYMSVTKKVEDQE